MPIHADAPVEHDAQTGSILLDAATGAVLPESATESGAVVEILPALSGAVLEVGSGAVASGALVTGTGSEAPSFSSGAVTEPLITRSVRVVMTEIAWMGSNVSTADEWVEIAGFGSGAAVLPQSLSGWTLVTVKAGVETVIARMTTQHVLSSGGVLIIANNPAASSRLATEPAIVTTGMSLPNTQLLLRLKNASGAVVDEADDGIGAPFAGANPSGGTKATMGRIDPWAAGTAATSWRTSTVSHGFDDGVPIFGTPGVLGLPPVDDPNSGEEGTGEPPPVGVPIVPVQPPPLLRLTEVLANPPGVDSDEWIEIGSFDAVPIDLTEWTLKTGTLRFALSGTLQPGEHRRFGKMLTGLLLPNSSGTVELLWRDKIVDAWTYGETAEGVSQGRALDGIVTPQCVPSPDAANTGAMLDPQIVVQSSSTSVGKMSLNLEARVAQGSMAGATCSWSYPDGYTSQSCNPPSHTLLGPISGDVFLKVNDYCGNTLSQLLHVEVSGKEEDELPFACMPSAFTGVVVSEVFPNPVGDDGEGEWIELHNPSLHMKPLCGWSLDDGERGSDPYRLDHLQLPPGERLVFGRPETGLALNNDGSDAVRLFAPLQGGGSGAYEIVRYGASPEGRSFSLRDDGVRVWMAPSPFSENIPDPVLWPEELQVSLVQAMPNPEGKDTDGGEWLEIENRTGFPLPLTGWTIRTKAAVASLNGVTLAPRERKRLTDMIVLPNSMGYLQLVDRDAVLQSTLAWESAKDGRSVTQQKPVADVSGLTLAGSNDCRIWQAYDNEKMPVTVTIGGIISRDIEECITFVLALTNEKKIEQKIYSDRTGDLTVFTGGTDIAEVLLRHGLAVVDEDSPSSKINVYRIAESEARDARRGVWADFEYATLVDVSRGLQRQRDLLSRQGLAIIPTRDPGVVEFGDIVEFTTNAPATILVAVGSGSFAPYAGPLAIDRDMEVRILATAEVQSASGSTYTEESVQSYALLKSRYPDLRISEVYPSPAKGESEWVELWNPTDARVSLTGWLIDDVEGFGSKPSPLPMGAAIEPFGILRFEGLPIALNNGGDSVRLIAPHGRTSHVLEYAAVKKGRAVAALFSDTGKQKGQCLTTHPTPGTINRCADETTKIAKKKKTASKVAPRRRTRPVRYRNVIEFTEETIAPGDLFRALIGDTYGQFHSGLWIVLMAGIGLLVWCAAAGTLLMRRKE